jgi:hypothetical protein
MGAGKIASWRPAWATQQKDKCVQKYKYGHIVVFEGGASL